MNEASGEAFVLLLSFWKLNFLLLVKCKEESRTDKKGSEVMDIPSGGVVVEARKKRGFLVVGVVGDDCLDDIFLGIVFVRFCLFVENTFFKTDAILRETFE